jgi:hypothetical protein
MVEIQEGTLFGSWCCHGRKVPYVALSLMMSIAITLILLSTFAMALLCSVIEWERRFRGRSLAKI